MTRAENQAAPETAYDRTDGPIQDWFGLSYANWLVWHRAHMQSMPVEWQRRFVELARELEAAYQGSPRVEFEVNTVEWVQAAALTDGQMRELGITVAGDDGDANADDADPWDLEYTRDGRTLSGYDRVAVPVPDPVAAYDHGRTYLPPDEDAIAAVRATRAAGPDKRRLPPGSAVKLAR